jgi:hypothetical protein
MQHVGSVFLCTLQKEKNYTFVLTKYGRRWYLTTHYRLHRFFRIESDNWMNTEESGDEIKCCGRMFRIILVIWKVLAPIPYTETCYFN